MNGSTNEEDTKQQEQQHTKRNEEKLPEGWIKCFSKSQKRYYYSHVQLKKNQWHRPTSSENEKPREDNKRRNETNENTESIGNKISLNEKCLSSVSTPVPNKKCKLSDSKLEHSQSHLVDSSALHSVAIIVPYRDLHPEQQRSMHLKRFIPHMSKFLDRQVSKGILKDYHIYIIEQSNDQRKFNRGKLLNIGFDYAVKQGKENPREIQYPHDIYIFHDVDLLPGNDLGSWYSRFPDNPIHIARCWDRYSNNSKYFGGIVSFSESDMKRINGFPNTFWGWGGEDDEMQKRCEDLNIKWDYPPKGSICDLENMSLQEKLKFLKAHRSWKCILKWEALDEHDKNWSQNGLADLSYEILQKKSIPQTHVHTTDKSRAKVVSKASKITVDVQLNGNHWLNKMSGIDYKG